MSTPDSQSSTTDPQTKELTPDQAPALLPWMDRIFFFFPLAFWPLFLLVLSQIFANNDAASIQGPTAFELFIALFLLLLITLKGAMFLLAVIINLARYEPPTRGIWMTYGSTALFTVFYVLIIDPFW